MNLQLLVQIETNVKLNLVDNDGKSMVKDEGSKEIHLVLFESVTDTYVLGWRIIKQAYHKFMNPGLKFDDWVIVDFDNCLNGNPHT